ncbi:MAG: helix-turn-helix domain-containing protein [Candidatus Hydrogenedentes bacterium]|nr:helix-turn-helix domain-containing protein [Candidatus Hydrogenedentota bacterium]
MSQFEFPGYRLKEQREALSLSMLDAYHETHVPIDYLMRLEKGELDELPATAYTVGFLTTYCRVLDLPAEPFIDAVRACRAARPEVKFLAPGALPDPAGPYPLWVRDAMTWAAICAILVLGWASYSIVIKPFAESTPDRVNAGSIEIVPPARFDME